MSVTQNYTKLKLHDNEIINFSTQYNVPSIQIIELLSIFNSFDGNGDGAITVQELISSISKLAKGFHSNKQTKFVLKNSENEVKELINTVDQNCDEKIQFDEFLKILAPNVESILIGNKRKRRNENSCSSISNYQSDNPDRLSPNPVTIKKYSNHLTVNSNFNNRNSTTSSLLSIDCSDNFSDGYESSKWILGLPTNEFIDNTLECGKDISEDFVKDTFKYFDKNEDEKIDVNEIETGMQNLGLNISQTDIRQMTLGKDELTLPEFRQICTKSNTSLNVIKAECNQNIPNIIVNDDSDPNNFIIANEIVEIVTPNNIKKEDNVLVNSVRVSTPVVCQKSKKSSRKIPSFMKRKKVDNKKK